MQLYWKNENRTNNTKTDVSLWMTLQPKNPSLQRTPIPPGMQKQGLFLSRYY